MGSIGLRLARRWTFHKPSCRAALPSRAVLGSRALPTGHSGRVFYLVQYGATQVLGSSVRGGAPSGIGLGDRLSRAARQSAVDVTPFVPDGACP